MLTELIVAVISQHIHMSNHTVHLKFMQCYISVISQ